MFNTKLSKKISWLLRHGAIESKLEMDSAGWVQFSDLCAHTQATKEELLDVIERNEKSRFALEEDRIRASQGHSLAGTPVTLEALEASWIEYTTTNSCWHGTTIEALAGIAQKGILAGYRSHVHLTAAIDSKVGIRNQVHVILEISPQRLKEAGQTLYQSPNGVILARYIPTSTIVDILPQSKRARKNIQQLKALFAIH